MRCPRCGGRTGADLRTCPRCGCGLAGLTGPADVRLDRATENGPIGPLRDFALRNEPVGHDGVTLRKPKRVASGEKTGRALRRFTPETAQPAPVAGPRPLSVRRPTPEVPKFRDTSGVPRREPTFSFDAARSRGVSLAARSAADDSRQWLSRRLLAGILDAAILVGINMTVVYFTLRLASLPMVSVGQLPLVPLVTFLLLFDFGYMAALTAAGGQTIGKMAMGLRVESGRGTPVTFSGSCRRTAAYLVSILPIGLGLLCILMRRRRPLHDLLADTRVVKA